MEPLSVNTKEKKLKENVIERLIIIFDFLNKQENKNEKFKIKELYDNLKANKYKESFDTFRKFDLLNLKNIYPEIIISSKSPATITFSGLKLKRRTLIKLKNPDYKLVLEILNGYFSSSKSSSFSVISDLQDYCGIKPEGILDFDSSEKQLEIVNNKDFLLKIIDAIQNGKQLKITLKKINGKIDFSPSLIKVFNKRWYLIGIKKDNNEIEYEIERFRLNDIQKIDDSPKSVSIKKEEMKELTNNYFKNRIGVSNELIQKKNDIQGNVTFENIKYDNKVEHKILLKIDREYYEKYFKEKPLFTKEYALNDNQKDEELNGKFKLVNGMLKINKELVTALFSYKSYIEVLEPIFLRDHMIEIIKELNEMYGVANKK